MIVHKAMLDIKCYFCAFSNCYFPTFINEGLPQIEIDSEVTGNVYYTFITRGDSAGYFIFIF